MFSANSFLITFCLFPNLSILRPAPPSRRLAPLNPRLALPPAPNPTLFSRTPAPLPERAPAAMSFSPVSGAAPGGVLCYSTTVANPHLKGSHVVYDVSVNTSRRADPAARSPDDLTELTVVERRYSDFEWLQTALTRTFPFCIIPPLPPKEAYKVLTSKSDQVFVEKRCRFLHFFLARVARHPLLSLSPAFHVFIYAADDATLKAAQDQKLPDLTCAQTLLALDRFRRAAVTLTYTPNDDRLDNPLQTPVSSAILVRCLF